MCLHCKSLFPPLQPSHCGCALSFKDTANQVHSQPSKQAASQANRQQAKQAERQSSKRVHSQPGKQAARHPERYATPRGDLATQSIRQRDLHSASEDDVHSRVVCRANRTRQQHSRHRGRQHHSRHRGRQQHSSSRQQHMRKQQQQAAPPPAATGSTTSSSRHNSLQAPLAGCRLRNRKLQWRKVQRNRQDFGAAKTSLGAAWHGRCSSNRRVRAATWHGRCSSNRTVCTVDSKTLGDAERHILRHSGTQADAGRQRETDLCINPRHQMQQRRQMAMGCMWHSFEHR